MSLRHHTPREQPRRWYRVRLWPLSLGVCLSASALGAPGGAACPIAEAANRPPAAWLTLVHGSTVQHLDAAALAQLPGTARTVQRRLTAPGTPGAGGAAGTPAAAEETLDNTLYAGWSLREVLARVSYAQPADRGARLSLIEAVASDGWRAWFSWGEVFNSPLGDQMLVIQQVNGQTLDSHAGPLALRSLGDTRPGPRHVRQLCALVVIRR